MIRQFIRDIVTDLTNAVARSELAKENADLRAGLITREQEVAQLRSRLMVAEKPSAFAPAPTSEEPSAELVERMGCDYCLGSQNSVMWAAQPEWATTKIKNGMRAVYRLIARDHAAAAKRVGELGEAFTDTNKRLVELADSLCRINETLGIGAVSFKDTESAVAELLSNRDCFARRLEEKTAEVARLSAPCPADAMDDSELGRSIYGAFTSFRKMGAKARELLGRAVK